ncbi:kinase-like domain-containing protein [Aspergillus karnatakaensis]|uniref:kinase-like domain-containing protein n=1 Tax=Aspergillus karnatakaensis TaxID=1810916 RepID=UPI003CCCA8FD
MDNTSQLLESPGCFVGTLSRWNAETGETSDPMMIHSREEIYVGRDPRRCQYIVTDPFISNRHLWIYTVIFDQDNPDEVAPLVYAQDVSMNGTLWNGYRMGNGRSSFLLSNNDILRLTGGVYLKYNCADDVQERCFTALQAMEMRTFSHEYIVTRGKLGSGAYGQVHMAYKRSTGQQFACKIVDLVAAKQRLAKDAAARYEKAFNKAMTPELREEYVQKQLKEKLDQYHREAKILETLQHPNVIGLEKVIQSGNTIYMFQDLLTAGDLFSHVQYKGGKLPDIEAAVIVRQIVISLDYLHDRNIVHRDLKPDNILMTSRADGCRVVLTDFGCATLVNSSSSRMSSIVGTVEFSAPEVVKPSEKGYTKAADLWSLGCLAAILLIGEAPFEEPPKDWISGKQRLAEVRRLKARMDRHKVGSRAQDFVFRLLQHNALERMNVKQALKHAWFTNPSHKSDFEALYRRSIRDWKPRTGKEPRIVGLEHQIRSHCTQLIEESSVPIKSEESSVENVEMPSQMKLEVHPWSDDADDERSGIISRLPSDTLSDLNFPQHENIRLGVGVPLSQRRGGASAKAHVVRHRRQPLGDQAERSPSDTDPAGQLFIAATSPSSDPSLRVRVLLEARERLDRSQRDNYSKYSRDSFTVEDEVYEEVSNPVTGKRQKLFYGAQARAA